MVISRFLISFADFQTKFNDFCLYFLFYCFKWDLNRSLLLKNFSYTNLSLFRNLYLEILCKFFKPIMTFSLLCMIFIALIAKEVSSALCFFVLLKTNSVGFFVFSVQFVFQPRFYSSLFFMAFVEV